MQEKRNSLPSPTSVLQTQFTVPKVPAEHVIRSKHQRPLSAGQPSAHDVIFCYPPQAEQQQQQQQQHDDDENESACMVQMALDTIQYHVGNEQWAWLVAANRTMYQALANQNKPQHQRLLSESIVLAIRGQQPAGRFLALRVVGAAAAAVDENNKTTKKYAHQDQLEWYDVGLEQAVSLTTQALALLSEE